MCGKVVNSNVARSLKAAYFRLINRAEALLVSLAAVVLLSFLYLYYYQTTIVANFPFTFSGLDYIISAENTYFSYLPLIPFCMGLVLMAFMTVAYLPYISDQSVVASRTRVGFYGQRIIDCCLVCIPFTLVTFLCLHLEAMIAFPSFMPIGESSCFYVKAGMADPGFSANGIALLELITIYLRYLLTAALFMLFIVVFNKPLAGIIVVLILAFGKTNEQYSFFIELAHVIGINPPVGTGIPSFNPIYYLYGGWGLEYDHYSGEDFHFYIPLAFITAVFMLGIFLFKKRDLYARHKK